jgi:hypothetical protein
LKKYHKLWLQELFPLTAPNFKTVLIDYNNDIFHLTSSGAMVAALGKFGSGHIKRLKNIGFLFDHFAYWIKGFPDELADFLLKLKAVKTIVLEVKERPEVDAKTQFKFRRHEGIYSVYDWLDLVAKPPTPYHAMIEEAFRAYIETYPKLYHMRGIRIFFFLPKSMVEMRFGRTVQSLVSSQKQAPFPCLANVCFNRFKH